MCASVFKPPGSKPICQLPFVLSVGHNSLRYWRRASGMAWALSLWYSGVKDLVIADAAQY